MRYQSFDQLFRLSLINLSQNIIPPLRSGLELRSRKSKFFPPAVVLCPSYMPRGNVAIDFGREEGEFRSPSPRVPSGREATVNRICWQSRINSRDSFLYRFELSTGADLTLSLPSFFDKIKNQPPRRRSIFQASLHVPLQQSGEYNGVCSGL